MTTNGSGELLLLGRQMQLAAGVMLVVYIAAVFILLPRELRFLRSTEPEYRGRFIFLDFLLQFCILLVLVPCILSPQLNRKSMMMILSGFTGLWLTVGAIAYLRYVYTLKVILRSSNIFVDKSNEVVHNDLTMQDAPESGTDSPEASR
jgi:hypothetical protein